MLGLKTHQEIDLRLCRSEESAETNRKMYKAAPETYIFSFEKLFLHGFVTEVKALEHELCYQAKWLVTQLDDLSSLYWDLCIDHHIHQRTQ